MNELQPDPEILIGVEQLVEIIETGIFTAYLPDCIPISLMLIGPSGAGKSKMVMQFQQSIGCHVTTDITSMGLQELLARDQKGELKFIMIPDFNIVLSHKPSTLQLTIGNLLSVTSEGSIRIDDGRAVKETKHSPIGIISAMTREMYGSIGRKWTALGFSRRFIPINYDYSLATREIIQKNISLGAITAMQLVEKKIKKPTVLNSTISEEDSNRIMGFSMELAHNLGWIATRSKIGRFEPKAVFAAKHLEFSPHITLRSLARANAIKHGRTVVSEEDIIFCMKVIGFTRFDRPVML